MMPIRETCETALHEALLCEALYSLKPGVEHVNAARDNGSFESFGPSVHRLHLILTP